MGFIVRVPEPGGVALVLLILVMVSVAVWAIVLDIKQDQRYWRERHELVERVRSNWRSPRAALCPHIQTSDDGTSYCDLAESRINELEAEVRRLRGDV